MPQPESQGTMVLGRYRIVARLAKGGMGVVFLARAEGAAGFAKPVVVKRILPDMDDDKGMTRMFAREARILSNLQHPGIVSVIDFGEENGAYVMVLDYVRAYHLGRWMRYLRGIGELLPVDVAIHVVVKVLDALEYAHTLKLPDGTPLGIVHADISPSNVLVDSEGQVKIVDFGIARAAGEGPTHATGSAGSVSIKGKMSYLAPEMLSGAPPDVRTDVYACGVVLYELLVGHAAFHAPDVNQTVARVLLERPPPVHEKRPDASEELGAIVARAMAKDRAERFPTAGDLARELRRVRKLPEDVAASMLADMVKRDYQGGMPEKLGLTPLNQLESMSRNPPAEPVALPSVDAIPVEVVMGGGADAENAPRRPSSNAPTRVLPQAALQPARRGSVSPVGIVVGMGALVVAGAAVFYAARHSTSEAPEVVVVEHGVVPSSTAAASDHAASSASATIPSASAVANEAPHAASAASMHGSKPPQSEADALSAAFSKNQPKIEACFRDDVADLKGAPEISVRFSIDQDGHVQDAEIFPAGLASLPLGQCILSVARQTRFPSQAAPAKFRIPIRAHRTR